MKIAISGHSGFIGTNLKSYLKNCGYTIIKINREDLVNKEKLKSKLTDCNIIIVLNGYPVIKRWTNRNKELIYNSRIKVNEIIQTCVIENNIQVEQYISASAIGSLSSFYYSDEDIYELGNISFLNELISDWEQNKLSKIGIKVSALRLGTVIDKDSQFVKQLKWFWKLNVSPVIGCKKNNLPLIGLNDLLRIVDFTIQNKLEGVINCVSNILWTNKTYYSAKAAVLIKLPNWLISILFGKASQMLTSGVKVYPKKLLVSGFEFKNDSFV